MGMDRGAVPWCFLLPCFSPAAASHLCCQCHQRASCQRAGGRCHDAHGRAPGAAERRKTTLSVGAARTVPCASQRTAATEQGGHGCERAELTVLPAASSKGSSAFSKLLLAPGCSQADPCAFRTPMAGAGCRSERLCRAGDSLRNIYLHCFLPPSRVQRQGQAP